MSGLSHTPTQPLRAKPYIIIPRESHLLFPGFPFPLSPVTSLLHVTGMLAPGSLFCMGPDARRRRPSSGVSPSGTGVGDAG